MRDPFLRLAEVTKCYEDRRVVNRVSLDVFEGEVVALLGSSGSGKTTTLRIIAGLETPDCGEVWLGGELVASNGRNLAPPHARGIGMVFQDLALWPHLTVAGNLEFVLAASGMTKHERLKRVGEILELVHIGPSPIAIPAGSPAANSSAPPWLAPWWDIRACSYSTNRCLTSTPI